MVTYRLRAVTAVAESVVTYMKSIGHRAKVGFVFSRPEPHGHDQQAESAAINWFEAPNNCHR